MISLQEDRRSPRRPVHDGLPPHLFRTGDVVGADNAVAQKRARSQEFTATLAHAIHRPALVLVPKAAVRVVVGDHGLREVARASQPVEPARLVPAGFRFRRSSLEAPCATCWDA